MLNPKTPEDAIKAMAEAQRKRALADMMETSDWTGARFERSEATQMDSAAATALTPQEPLQIGRGGEILPTGPDAGAFPGIVDTVRDSPDYLTAQASCDRLNLVAEAANLSIPTDAAESIGARNSLEKMLAHQLGAAHVAAMQLLAAARDERFRARNASAELHFAASAETCRLTNAAARMMAAYNDGLLTLQRIRTGARQVVTVQHVQVNAGGQAVVAGSVRSRRRRGVMSGG